MDILNELKSRRSIRAYETKHISKDEMEKIIEAGLFAASGMGKQATVIVAITNKDVRDDLSKLNAKVMGKDVDPFYGALDVLAVFSEDGNNCAADGALVLGNMMNEASSIGVGSCWINRAKEVFEFDEGKAYMKKWGVPENYKGVGFLIAGYAAKEGVAAERKPDRVIYVD